MCEYCGCRDIATIAKLTREHHAVVAKISRVRTAARHSDTDRAAAVARRISEILLPHTAVFTAAATRAHLVGATYEHADQHAHQHSQH